MRNLEAGCETRSRVVDQRLQQISGVGIASVACGQRKRTHQQPPPSGSSLDERPHVFVNPAIKHSREDILEIRGWDALNHCGGRYSLGFEASQYVETNSLKRLPVPADPEKVGYPIAVEVRLVARHHGKTGPKLLPLGRQKNHPTAILQRLLDLIVPSGGNHHRKRLRT